MASNLLQCPICKFISLNLKLYVSHLRLVHAKDPAFDIMCGVGGCREVFRAFSAFNSHIYRHHRDAIGITATHDSIVESSDASAALVYSATDYQFETSAVVVEPINTSTTTTTSGNSRRVVSDLKEIAAKFLLALREGRQISQAAITDVITGCKDLCQHTILTIKGMVQGQLAEAGIEFDQLPGLNAIFDADYNPFHGVDTNHLFEGFCIEHLGCLVSS